MGIAADGQSSRRYRCGTGVIVVAGERQSPRPAFYQRTTFGNGTGDGQAVSHTVDQGYGGSIDLNPGTAGARTLLDVPVWDFDDQGTRPLDRPARIRPGDRLRVTCTHDQELRDRLPSFEGQAERYVVWGEGTTDEMCLGMLSVAFE